MEAGGARGGRQGRLNWRSASNETILKMNITYAAAPARVGEPEQGHSPPQCPVEETRCPVVAHDWVNDEYKHLVVKATPKALAAQPGQFFQLLCPSPDAIEVWFRRPQSVYRVARSSGRLEFLYKVVGRGTQGLATLKPGETLDMVGPSARASPSLRSGRTSSSSGAASALPRWRRSRRPRARWACTSPRS